MQFAPIDIDDPKFCDSRPSVERTLDLKVVLESRIRNLHNKKRIGSYWMRVVIPICTRTQ